MPNERFKRTLQRYLSRGFSPDESADLVRAFKIIIGNEETSAADVYGLLAEQEFGVPAVLNSLGPVYQSAAGFSGNLPASPLGSYIDGGWEDPAFGGVTPATANQLVFFRGWVGGGTFPDDPGGTPFANLLEYVRINGTPP